MTQPYHDRREECMTFRGGQLAIGCAMAALACVHLIQPPLNWIVYESNEIELEHSLPASLSVNEDLSISDCSSSSSISQSNSLLWSGVNGVVRRGAEKYDSAGRVVLDEDAEGMLLSDGILVILLPVDEAR